jgi:hypothetical protein
MTNLNENYKIVSADFVTLGDSGDPDAFIDAASLANIKKTNELNGFLQAQIASRLLNTTPHENLTIIELREQKFEYTEIKNIL